MKLNHIKAIIVSSVTLAVALGLAPSSAQADYVYVANLTITQLRDLVRAGLIWVSSPAPD